MRIMVPSEDQRVDTFKGWRWENYPEIAVSFKTPDSNSKGGRRIWIENSYQLKKLRGNCVLE